MTDTRSWIGFWLLGFWVRVLWLKLSSIECLSIHNSTILTLNYDHYHIIHHFCYLWRRRRSIFFLHYNNSSHGFQFALSITVIQKKVGKIILIFRTQSSVLTIITGHTFCFFYLYIFRYLWIPLDSIAEIIKRRHPFPRGDVNSSRCFSIASWTSFSEKNLLHDKLSVRQSGR